MKANEDKHIEKFIDRVIKETSLETPSFDFTSKVMSEVLSIKANDVTVYKPLISKSVWILIFGGFMALSSYLIVTVDMSASVWITNFDFSLIYNNRFLSEFSGLEFSKISLYAIILASIMLFIQMALLKKRFDKQFEE